MGIEEEIDFMLNNVSGCDRHASCILMFLISCECCSKYVLKTRFTLCTLPFYQSLVLLSD